MQAIRDVYHLLRWRLIAVRYLGKIRRYLTAPALPRRTADRGNGDSALARQGHAPGPRIADAELDQIRAIYGPRAAAVVPTETGHPFVNLMRAEDIHSDNPVMRFAFSREVLDGARDYFGDDFRYDSIQVLYSFPTAGSLRESQMWHRDYGDTKSFHCVAYVNDVLEPEDGPFVFVDRNDAKRIASAPIIRRIPDEKFRKELGDGQVRSFFGKAGESVFVDPSACYHFGSRCERARTAIFVTFNTHRPFVAAYPLMRENRQKLIATAKAIRPDLSHDYIERILSV